MAKIKTHCSCGLVHEFEGEKAKHFSGDIPEYIECGECPECSPELLDNPEAHEDEAYKEEIDIEKLNDELFIEEDFTEDDLDEDEQI